MQLKIPSVGSSIGAGGVPIPRGVCSRVDVALGDITGGLARLGWVDLVIFEGFSTQNDFIL